MAKRNQQRVWPEVCEELSEKEGWALFTTDDKYTIQRLDCAEEVAEDRGYPVPQLESDDQALDLVIRKALEGSPMHILALYMDGQSIDAEESPAVWRLSRWVVH